MLVIEEIDTEMGRHIDIAKLKAELRDAIKTEVKESIHKAIAPLEDRIASINENPFRVGWRLVGQLGAPIAIGSFVIALLAITAAAVYQTVASVKEETEFRTNTTRTLQDIEASIRKLEAVSDPKKVLKELANLSPPVFAKNLSALRRVVDHDYSAVLPTEGNIKAVAKRLQEVDDRVDGYWPTLLQFIKFSSEWSSPNAPQPGPPNIIFSDTDMSGHAIGPLRHQVLLIEGGSLSDFVCYECRIILTENVVRMRNVKFVNCVFELPVVESPSEFLKKAGRQLLASAGSAVTTMTGI